jgi:hypothetical protein
MLIACLVELWWLIIVVGYKLFKSASVGVGVGLSMCIGVGVSVGAGMSSGAGVSVRTQGCGYRRKGVGM